MAVRLAFLSALVLAWTPGAARAYCPLTTGNPMPEDGGQCRDTSGEPLSWHEGCVSYSIVRRTRAPLDFDEVRDIVDYSFQAWTEADCSDGPVALQVRQTQALSQCAEAEHNPTGGNVNTIAFVEDWAGEELGADAFALTKVWHDPATGEIVGADMLINENQGRFEDCGEQRCPSGVIDLENVITHEAGHFLGLGHSGWSDATMYFQAEKGEVKKRHLDRDDVEGLCALYGSGGDEDLCRSHDFVPIGGFEPGCDPPAPEGCNCRLALARHGPIPASGALPCLLGLWLAFRRRRRRCLPTARPARE